MNETRTVLVAGLAMLVVAPGCRRPTPLAPPAKTPERTTAASEETNTHPSGRIPERVDLKLPVADPNRWLTVEKVKDGAPGAWATGGFDAKRNKLTITTKDVAQFAIDTARIPIRWDRLVIIRIDGRNSELVRRSSDILQFVNDKSGWHVVD